MANVVINDKYLEEIAGAIRSKTQTQHTYAPSEMKAAIEGIQTFKEEEVFNVVPKIYAQTITPSSEDKVFKNGTVQPVYEQISTSTEMDAVNIDANIGKMYKYIGTSERGYYKNALYIIEPNEVSLTYNLTNCTGDETNPTQIEPNSEVQLHFTAHNGYTLPATITVSSGTSTWDRSTGTLTLQSGNEDISINIAAVEGITITIVKDKTSLIGYASVDYHEYPQSSQSISKTSTIIAPIGCTIDLKTKAGTSGTTRAEQTIEVNDVIVKSTTSRSETLKYSMAPVSDIYINLYNWDSARNAFGQIVAYGGI